MGDTVQTVLTVAGGILGALLTAWGAVRVAKLAAKAQLKGVEIEQDKVRAGAYTESREAYREVAGDLRKEIAELWATQELMRRAHREELDERDERHRQQIVQLRDERREQMANLNDRLDELEAKRDSDRRLIEALNDYIRALLRLLRNQGITPPPAPVGMHFDD